MSSYLASQGRLTGLTKKFDGKTPVRIHLLDNSSKVFLAEDSTTVQEILRQTLSKCGTLDIEMNLPYFGLFESKNGASIDGSLGLDLLVFDVLSLWNEQGISETAKFLFMIRLHMPCLWGLQFRDVVAFRLNKPKSVLSLQSYLSEAEVIDINSLHLQFIQAVYNVITGRYPTTTEQALDLGAIHFLVKFGEYHSSSHKVGFLGNRIVEFIPVKHLRSASSGTSIAEWESNLLSKVQFYASNAHEESSDDADYDNSKVVYFHLNGKPITAEHKYMELVFKMSNVYGNTYYKCTQHCSKNLPEQVYLGVHHHGLSVFDKGKRIVCSFHIEDIYRWGFKPNQMFYLEVCEDNDYSDSGNIEFDTVEGKTISDLLTDYAMAFLREREREDARQDLMKGGSLQVPTPAINRINTTHEPPIVDVADSRSTSKGTAVDSRKISRQEAAAIKIQALGRGFTLRNDWVKEDAAILIQSVYRGYRARVFISKMIEEIINRGGY